MWPIAMRLSYWFPRGDLLREQIRKTRALTDKPFGVNLPLIFSDWIFFAEFYWRIVVAVVILAAVVIGEWVSAKVREAIS